MATFAIFNYQFKPVNEPFQPDFSSPEVKAEESMEKIPKPSETVVYQI